MTWTLEPVDGMPLVTTDVAVIHLPHPPYLKPDNLRKELAAAPNRRDIAMAQYVEVEKWNT